MSENTLYKTFHFTVVMDYAFGFDKLAVDLFGAKNAAIDEMRNYFGEKSDFSFGNYVPATA